MQNGWVVWLAVLAPLLGTLLSTLADSPRRAAQLCIFGSWVAVASAVFILGWRILNISVAPFFATIPFWTVATYDKAGANIIDATHPFHPDFGIYLDNFAACALLITAVVGLIVQLYLAAYLRTDQRFRRPFWSSSLMLTAAFFVVVSPDLMQTAIALGFGGMMAAILLFHDWGRVGAGSALPRFVVANGMVLAALAFACVIIFVKLAGSSIDVAPPGQDANDVFNWSFLSVAWSSHVLGVGPLTTSAVALLILFAVVMRALQFPLEGWVTSLAESGASAAMLTSVAFAGGGIILLLRAFPLFVALPNGLAAVAIVGLSVSALAVYKAYRAMGLLETGLFLALAHLGLALVAVGFGAWSGAAFAILVDGVVAALLVLALTNVVRGYRNNVVAEVKGIRKTMPATSIGLLIAIAGISGLPPLVGWWELEWIQASIYANAGIMSVSQNPTFAAVALVVAVMVSIALAAIGWRLWFRLSGGEAMARKGLPAPRVAEVDLRLRIPLVPLQVLVLLGGLVAIPQLPQTFARFVFYPGLQPVPVVWLPVAISVIAALVGLVVGWRLRGADPIASALGNIERDHQRFFRPLSWGVGAWAGIANVVRDADVKVIGGAAQMLAGVLQYSGSLGERVQGRSTDRALLLGVAMVLTVVAASLLVAAASFASGWLK
jgi:NADH:ubiquinone oxidoreductase subunit 5 (subunit L)/multisubunit Na+/H+ antiporter MnhA subunit